MNSELKCEVCRLRCDSFAKRVGDVVTIETDNKGGRILRSIVDAWSFGHSDQPKSIGVICNSCVELMRDHKAD